MYVLAASRAEARMNWLNRLRSAKGFPVEPGLRMEDFLNSATSQDRSPALSCTKSCQVKTESGEAQGDEKARARVKGATKKKSLAAVKEEKKDWLEMTNNALAELFCMRQDWKLDDRKKTKRKRKQDKPRICPSLDANSLPSLSANDDNIVEKPGKASDKAVCTSSPLSAVNSVVAGAGKKEYDGEISPVKKRKGFREIADDSIDGSKRSNADISSSSCNSCTEVTLIDTSLSIWRSRKVMYRKGSVWKVGDKKAESVSDKCTLVDGHLPARKGSKSIATSSSRIVEDNNAAHCSAPVKIQTRRAHDSNSISSTKDTNDHSEVRTEVEGQRIPQTRNRCGTKRHLYSGSMDCSDDGTLAEIRKQATEESLKVVPQSIVCPDHPVNQPIETLLFSLYQVFLQAGKMGLTAREAVSRILEKGLPGLHGGGIVPRIQVAKILKTSPYFMQLEESKFVLCSAIIGNEGQHLSLPINLIESREEVILDGTIEKSELVKKEKQSRSWQHLATVAAIRRVRTRRRSLILKQSKVKPCLSRKSVKNRGGS
ncbi:uncharacterized protein LOC131073643 [Cryptomeria japonica]|uniref:uncharacterized protein LOC131073643 n=1 Tax=Cryptomeria japonica TaxID=3369 RepID=UPI0025AC058C|nr:uncharacterized protein LOC131073643 [Cryptomeria japonica]